MVVGGNIKADISINGITERGRSANILLEIVVVN
jgi:hypothetical protein